MLFIILCEKVLRNLCTFTLGIELIVGSISTNLLMTDEVHRIEDNFAAIQCKEGHDTLSVDSHSQSTYSSQIAGK